MTKYSSESGAASQPPVTHPNSFASAPPVGQAGPAPVPPAGTAHHDALTMPRSRPVRLQIPSIGVDSALIPLGLQADETMEVPPNGFPAGWYTGAPTPGELGPAIIAGHVHWDGRPGVFYSLSDIEPDDTLTVRRKDNNLAVFRVTKVQQFPKDDFPTDAVYGNIDHAGLRLITCGGFNAQTSSYDDNTVVFATLAAAHSRPPD
ncbi:MAG: class F sortase [Propionibacteriales bacterium]|nr:class F sortase [Propionibacteriales bacterium]